MYSLNKVLKVAQEKLKKISTSASLDAEVLLSYILNKDKIWLYSHPQYKIPLFKYLQFKLLINKRKRNYSIARLTGQKQFYGFDFKVNKHTLIPRPESELFIDELKKIKPKNLTIVDIGTGSGCLIVTAAKLFPNNKFVAVDISQQALKVAKQNSKNHSVSIEFIQSNLLNAFDIRNLKFDILLANLPYLTLEQLNEPSIQKEPKQALIAGDDGLQYYKQLIEQISKLNYRPKHILLEINPEQADKLTQFIKTKLPSYKLEIIPDLSGKTRLIRLH